jgi:hypothetical protein
MACGDGELVDMPGHDKYILFGYHLCTRERSIASILLGILN